MHARADTATIVGQSFLGEDVSSDIDASYNTWQPIDPFEKDGAEHRSTALLSAVS